MLITWRSLLAFRLCRGGCPTLEEEGKTRQAIVTLDEASWYNSSGSPEYMVRRDPFSSLRVEFQCWPGHGVTPGGERDPGVLTQARRLGAYVR